MTWTRSLIAVAFAGLAIQQQTPTAGPNIGVMDALELYALGDPEIVKMVASPQDIGSIARALVKDGSAWIRANGPSETSHRRMVAATFGLEAVGHGFDKQDERAVDSLLRWAGSELRSETKPTETERLWRQGAIAVLQGVGAISWVENQLNMAKDRFPAEPRWMLVRAWLSEVSSGSPISYAPPLEGMAELPPSVVRAYEDARQLPPIRAEASTRLAFLRCAAGKTDLAIDLAREGERSTEPEIQSLAHLIQGWALFRSNREADALAEFRAAHDALPQSQSATFWLARQLFLDGRRGEAQSLVDTAIQTGLGDMDPFRVYSRGDFRRWPAIVKQLREAIR